MRNLFSDFFKNIARSFSPKNLVFHLLAIGLTWVCVHSGFDWQWFLLFHSTTIYTLLFPSVYVGMLVPFLVPIFGYTFGYLFKYQKLIITTSAVTQAAMIGWIISSTYKAFTGRIPPSFSNFTQDISHGFQLGFWRAGIFWGWPSSHTTVAFAMSASLMTLFPRSKIIRFLAPLYALYIGIGVSMSIHWFSEFIAGAIFGAIIGVVVGTHFRKTFLTLVHTEK